MWSMQESWWGGSPYEGEYWGDGVEQFSSLKTIEPKWEVPRKTCLVQKIFKKSEVNIDDNQFKFLDSYDEDEARSTEEYEQYLEDLPMLEKGMKRPTRTRMPRVGGKWNNTCIKFGW